MQSHKFSEITLWGYPTDHNIQKHKSLILALDKRKWIVHDDGNSWSVETKFQKQFYQEDVKRRYKTLERWNCYNWNKTILHYQYQSLWAVYCNIIYYAANRLLMIGWVLLKVSNK